MNTTLTFDQYPAWFIIFCLLLGAVYAFVLYFRNSFLDHPTPGQKRMMQGLSVLRFLAVSIIAFLLLSPLLRSRFTETQKPSIVLLHDNSQSIDLALDGKDSVEYTQQMSDLVEQLEEKYEVKQYNFDTELRSGGALNYKGQQTNLSNNLSDIFNLFNTQNVGGIIVASDGIYNQGANPVYAIAGNANFPLYTIALGDTTPKKDVLIEKVYYNDIAYLNDRFELGVDINSHNLSGQTLLSVYDMQDPKNPREIVSKTVEFTEEKPFLNENFVLEAKRVGVQRYRVAFTPVEGEFTTSNNSTDFFIEVLDSRQQILILAQGPHPDITAIKEAVTSNKNYEIEHAYIKNAGSLSFKDYDLVILHQIPSRKAAAKEIVEQIKKAGTSVLFILGSQSSMATFNQVQDAVKIQQSNPNQNLDLVTASVNPEFTLFNFSESLSDELKEFPPLSTPFGTYSPNPGTKVLMYQKIGSVSSSRPLIAFYESLGSKVGIIAGEGIWRWRLYDYRFHENHDLFNQLVIKIVQYMSVKADKRQFKVKLQKKIFRENEAVEMEAELYNEAFELVNTPDVAVTISDEDGKEFPFAFDKTGKAYTLNAGSFEPGSYTFEAKAVFNGKTFDYNGQFSVTAVNIEVNQITANHQTLYQLSELSGGELFYPDQVSSLASLLQDNDTIKPRLYETFEADPLIKLKWIFFLILSLLSVEWFIRKYQGGY